MNKPKKQGGKDVQVMTINGTDEVMLSLRGVVKLAYCAWRDENNPNGKELVRRFYEYISAHGYNSAEVELTMKMLESVSIRHGMVLLDRHFEKFVQNQVDAVKYIMEGVQIDNV